MNTSAQAEELKDSLRATMEAHGARRYVVIFELVDREIVCTSHPRHDVDTYGLLSFGMLAYAYHSVRRWWVRDFMSIPDVPLVPKPNAALVEFMPSKVPEKKLKQAKARLKSKKRR